LYSKENFETLNRSFNKGKVILFFHVEDSNRIQGYARMTDAGVEHRPGPNGRQYPGIAFKCG
jgi:hypothetical protein